MIVKDIELTGCLPRPVLYLQNIIECNLTDTCNTFFLEQQGMEDGYLVQPTRLEKNYKLLYLDLFFASLGIVGKFPNAQLYILEINPLRESLELNIMGRNSYDTLLESKVVTWKNRDVDFSLSIYAQAPLYQAGFLSFMENDVMDLVPAELDVVLAMLG